MKLFAFTLLALSFFCAGCSPDTPKEKTWAYTGSEAPVSWGKYSPACTQGKSQSPINIVSSYADTITPTNLLFFTKKSETSAKVIDYGHFVRVKSKGVNSITIKGINYKLSFIDFHSKSEHLIDGLVSDMEMQIHYKNVYNKYAVVAVLMNKGRYNKALEPILRGINGGSIKVNPQELLPQSTVKYYHYEGSLTSPPCTQAVKWYVMQDKIELSSEQLAVFHKAYHANARPVQELNKRYLELK